MTENNNTFIEYNYENLKYEYRINIHILKFIDCSFIDRKFNYLWLRNDLKKNIKQFIDNTINPENFILTIFLLEQTVDQTVVFHEAKVLIELVDICLPISQSASGNYIICAGENDPLLQKHEYRRIKPFKNFIGSN